MNDWIIWLITGAGVALMVFLMGPVVLGTLGQIGDLWNEVLDNWAAAWRALRRRD